MTILDRDELARARQAMMLGLARQPLTTPAKLTALLAAAGPTIDPGRIVLALATQRQRFERPATCVPEEVPPAARQIHADARPILSAVARRALVRLSNAVAKGHASHVLQAATSRIVAAGYRPHPFDLPWLMPHIKHNVACLGLAERAYLALSSSPLSSSPGGDDQPSILHAQITHETWTDFPKGHRREFLTQQRRADPAAARALLEGVFKNEPAPVRAELLGAMRTGLGPDDLPFLESLTGDRADSVKAVAARLLASVPGTPAHAARLGEAAACFKKTSGVKSLMSRIGLAPAGTVEFAAPKGNQAAQAAAVQALFGGLALPEISAATGLSANDVLGALPLDGIVIDCFVATATAQSDDATRRVLFDHKLGAIIDAPHLVTHTLMALATISSEPASPDMADRLLGCEGWSGLIKRLTLPEGSLLAIAGLLPVAAIPAFLAAIEPVAFPLTREARAFAELMIALGSEPAPSSSASR